MTRLLDRRYQNSAVHQLVTSLAFLLVVASASTQAADWLYECTSLDGNNLLFYSDFEGDLEVTPVGSGAIFSNLSYYSNRNCPTNWFAVGAANPDFHFGSARIQYQGGNLAQRGAYLEPNAGFNRSQGLSFSINQAFTDLTSRDVKARVQMDLHGNTGIHAISTTTKLKLGSGLAALSAYPAAIDWITLAEWWNDGPWVRGGYGFSITLNLVRPAGVNASELYFKVEGREFDTTTRASIVLWQYINTEYSVPVDQWIDLAITVVEGDADSGRLNMKVATEGQPQKTLFNLKATTHHPDDSQPDGFQAVGPIKLYTSEELVSFLNGRNQPLDIYFDNLSIQACKALDDSCALLNNVTADFTNEQGFNWLRVPLFK